MKYNTEWKNYKIITTGDGYKLENFGGKILLRPDPQIIWKSSVDMRSYNGLNAVYERSSTGGGQWNIVKDDKKPEFYVHWRDLTFSLKMMGFKHVGIFPEQAVNWDKMSYLVKQSGREIKVLNLFGYTGGATVALAKVGAKVCHVDASKAMCDKAKENAELSKVPFGNTRYIMDDCLKFVEKEIRRGNFYDAIIMDPPSYGRGPKGEMWKIEDKIYELVELCKNLMSGHPLFFLINSYTTGLQPTVMKNILDIIFKDVKHTTEAYEVGLATEEPEVILPCGCSALTVF